MNFHKFSQEQQAHFATITQDVNTVLFQLKVDKDAMWQHYLDSFPSDPVFKTNAGHDCSCCRKFIKEMGAVVVIKDNEMVSIWDFTPSDPTYAVVAKKMSEFVHQHKDWRVFLHKERSVGNEVTYSEREDGSGVSEWFHFYLPLPTQAGGFNSERQRNSIRSKLEADCTVMEGTLQKISADAIRVVLELVSDKTLYKGSEWEAPLARLLEIKNNYDQLSEEKKTLFAISTANKAGPVVSRIKNHSIGVLLQDLTRGVDLDAAVKAYERIVAPHNYKRPKAIFTKKMLEEAQKTVTGLGYMPSLYRRHATIDDITVNNILFVDRDTAPKVDGAEDVFAEMHSSLPVKPTHTGRHTEMDVDTFVKNVLPTAASMELHVESRLQPNLMSLIAPEHKSAPSMLKWDNNFCWAYNGNIADSAMKERVAKAGGKVDGDLRFSIQWNDADEHNRDDLDAHCVEPNRFRIYYRNKRRLSPNKGMLDVDIIHPDMGVPAVENITYASRNDMSDGDYLFQVNCFSHNGGTTGFAAEIEFDGQLHKFELRRRFRPDEFIDVATVTLKDGKFTIKPHLDSSLSVKDVWGIKTNTFVPVSTVMMSPNYWDQQSGIGHQHLFFILQGCKNPDTPNGFYNEFLKEDLMTHKRVFEALGSRMKVEQSEDQLSGVGFSLTKRNDVLLKVKGQTERLIKLKI